MASYKLSLHLLLERGYRFRGQVGTDFPGILVSETTDSSPGCKLQQILGLYTTRRYGYLGHRYGSPKHRTFEWLLPGVHPSMIT